MTESERELPKGWRWVPFGEVAEHRLGKMLDKRKNRGTLRPYLRNVNVRWHGFDLGDVLEMRIGDDEIDKYTVRKGDLVICEGGEPGRAAIWQRDYSIAYQKALHRARPREGVEAKYLLYMLEDAAMSGRLARHFTGSTINHLTGQALAEVMVPLAPPDEQHRIVEKIEELFSDLDAGVQALQAVRRQLDRYRQSVLKAAVEGDLTRAWREQHGADVEPAEILLERILEERHARWEAETLKKYEAQGKKPPKGWQSRYRAPHPPEADGLPELPEGWRWVSAESVCAGVDSGNTPPRDQMMEEGDVPFVKVYNLTMNGKLDFTINPTWISWATHSGCLRKSMATSGDVLMNIVGPPLGKVSMLPDTYPHWNFNQAVVVFRPLSGLDNRFLLYCLLAESVTRRVTSLAAATAGQYNISVNMCRAMALPLPPLAEQKAIVEEVERRLSVVDAVAAEVDQQLARAGRLRRAILQHAFEGKLVPQDPNDESADVLPQRPETGKAGVRLREGVEAIQIQLDL